MPTLPPCFPILNLEYFTNIQDQISAFEVADAAAFQDLVNEVFGQLSLLESTIQSQITFLEPINLLLTPPGIDPSAIVTWITSFINDVLTPLVKPYITATEQLAALAIAIENLTISIEAAEIRLGISIEIPTISISCTL